MSSLDNHPLWCSRHGFTDVIRPGNTGVASVRKENCPWCRAEKAEAALATARETAVREFAEWLERSGPGCGMSLYHDMVGRGEETQVSFEEAAARFLAETGKEPK